MWYPVLQNFLLCWCLYYVSWWNVHDVFPLGPRSKECPVAVASRWVSLIYTTGLAAFTSYVLWYGYNPILPLFAAAGYFLWDMVLCVVYRGSFKDDVLFHAVICGIGYLLVLHYNYMLYESAVLLLFEWSTPILNIGLLAKTYRYGLTTIACYTLFSIIFFLVRVVFGTVYIFYYVLPHAWLLRTQYPWGMTLWTLCSVTAAACLNICWAYKLFQSSPLRKR